MYGMDFFTIGKTVKSIRMDSDYAILMFDDGTHQTFAVEGDCCSYSYFTDFVGVAKLIGAPILSVEEVSVDTDALGIKDSEPDSYECIQIYGYKFVTELGESTLVFRNSSNGYYGGWMYMTNAYLDTLEDIYTDIIAE